MSTIPNRLLRLCKRTFKFAGSRLLRTGNAIPEFRLTSSEAQLLVRNTVFRDKHKGRRCFVIATGPSLKTQDITPLGDEITFVMSGFWKHEVTEHWQPTYYCVSDPIYFDGSATMKNFFASLTARCPNSTFFVPLAARDVIREQQLLPRDKTYPVAFEGDLDQREIKELDFTKLVPSAMTVSQFCLMLAIYMGCSPIYLLGFDHDWLSHRGTHRHFYEGLGGLESHPQVRPELTDQNYKEMLECALVIWRGYEVLLELARRKGIQILDATNGGFLDVFEPATYEDLVGGLSSNHPDQVNHDRTIASATLS
jgi:hypothetical protein